MHYDVSSAEGVCPWLIEAWLEIINSVAQGTFVFRAAETCMLRARRDCESHAVVQPVRLIFDLAAARLTDGCLVTGVLQGFQPLPKGSANGEVISALPAAPEEVEDLSEFKFAKFAATFFQGNVGPQYSRKALKQSLLPLQTQGDQLVRVGRARGAGRSVSLGCRELCGNGM